MSEEILVYAKKDHRNVSSFMSEQLLFDYITDNLDLNRKKTVENYLKFSIDAQGEVKKIKSGIKYLENFKELKVAPEIVKEVQQNATHWNMLLEKFQISRLPLGVRWGMESIFITILVIAILIVLPWQKTIDQSFFSPSKELVLAEVFRVNPVKDVVEKPEYVDEGIKNLAANEIKKQLSAQVPAETINLGVFPENKIAENPVAEKSETVEMQKTVVKPKTANEPITEDKKQEIIGFLYRGILAVKNLEVVGPKITDKIVELGGRKAGAVDLGWKKTPQSMYYHFTIPSAKYDELITFLNLYGKVNVAKERHSRIMPDGISRLIISLEEAK